MKKIQIDQDTWLYVKYIVKYIQTDTQTTNFYYGDRVMGQVFIMNNHKS